MLDVTGAYGLSFLMLLVNGGIAHWWTHRKQAQATHYVWASLTLTGFVFLFGLARLSEPERGTPLPVAAMQDNFVPFQPPSDRRTYRQSFEDLTARAAASVPKPELYVWAESAAPGDALHDAESRALMQHLALQAQAPVLIGSRVTAPETQQEANSSVLFLPDGSPPTFYDKQQFSPVRRIHSVPDAVARKPHAVVRLFQDGYAHRFRPYPAQIQNVGKYRGCPRPVHLL